MTNYKLTIDRDLLTQTPMSAAILNLQRWKSEARVELIEAEPSTRTSTAAPANVPPKTGRPASGSKGWYQTRPKVAAGKVVFGRMAAILFPGRDVQRLNMTEVNDVAHLVRHHLSGNELFVTGHAECFIEGGRRDLLKANFGVVAMTPEETVRMLSETHGWK